MKALRSALRQYIALRRALGTKLQEPAATLERFIDFLEREKAEFITFKRLPAEAGRIQDD